MIITAISKTLLAPLVVAGAMTSCVDAGVTDKAKEAYIRGGQMVKDSAAGKAYVKPEYKIPVDTILPRLDGYDIKSNSMFEAAGYYNGEELLILKNNEPERLSGFIDDYSPNFLHYWNLIARAGAERKAFNDGANAERAKLNK